MSTDLTPLRLLPQRAADYLREHGWTRHTERESDGRVCLTGALRYCDPQPGDWLIARAVFRHLDLAEDWNDSHASSQYEVEEALRSVEITGVLLAETFGPQWEPIVALVRRAAVLSNEETQRLHAARGAAEGAAWYAAEGAAWYAAEGAAWYAARDAARGAAEGAAWYAAWYAARGAAEGAAWYAAWYAARGAAEGAARVAARVAAGDAAWALVVRDLIGQHGFTADHYRTVTDPWASVIGPAHPDDERDGLYAGGAA